MKSYLVSVIITYYKKRRYIEKTINSLKQQTYNNYQLVFVYDDPNKEDLVFLRKILSKIKNKKILINKNNLGVAESRNKAKKFIKGKFTAFLDADDIWKKNKLKDQIKIMQNNDVDLSYTSYDIINQNGKQVGKRIVSGKSSYKELSKRCEIGLSTVIIKSSVFKKSKFPNLKTQEDLGLWLDLSRKGYVFQSLKKILSSWRKVDDSLSTNNFQKLADAFKLFYFFEKKNVIFSIYSVLVLSINKIFNKDK